MNMFAFGIGHFLSMTIWIDSLMIRWLQKWALQPTYHFIINYMGIVTRKIYTVYGWHQPLCTVNIRDNSFYFKIVLMPSICILNNFKVCNFIIFLSKIVPLIDFHIVEIIFIIKKSINDFIKSERFNNKTLRTSPQTFNLYYRVGLRRHFADRDLTKWSIEEWSL